MRGQHPLWRGFFLAAALAAIRFFLGEADSLAVFRAERPALVFCGAMAVGSLLGALPAMLRRKAWKTASALPSKKNLLLCFLCGAGMALGLGLAGSGAILTGLLTGSAGAYAFCGAALTAGFCAVRLTEGRHAA